MATKLRWEEGPYVISSDPALLNLPTISSAFASEEMFWATPLDAQALQVCLSSSLCLGLYRQIIPAETNHSPPLIQIGLARIITDYVTFAYLTDVFIFPEERGKGLGLWLMRCIDEVLEKIPYLRRAILFTGAGKKEDFYTKEMGFVRVQQEKRGQVVMHRFGNAATDLP